MVMPESSEGHRTASRRANRPLVGPRVPLRRLLRVASIACGIQFGWALQLSLLTPYIQELGIPHAWSSLIWLCGPISGLFVQPLVGHMSDHCTSRYGRRRPFIVAGALSIVLAVLVIGHSADLGWWIGDRGDVRPRAIVFFVVGFWILDVANNVSQGPCRALLADLTAQEIPLVSNDRSSLVVEESMGESGHASEAFFWDLFHTFRHFSGYIWVILLVTSLTWIAWFPFILFDTDWMGREIYGGKPNEGQTYSSGVRMGAFGLLCNSVVLGITSLLMEKLCRKWGAGFIWGISNIFMGICFLTILVVTYVANNMGYIGHDLPPNSIVSAALIIFALLGAPLAITYSVPYAMISSRAESLQLGQGEIHVIFFKWKTRGLLIVELLLAGLSAGVLNLAIVFPQVVVSLGSGPWDQLFGGGNSPAFAVAALAAFASGLIAILALPRSGAQNPRNLT
ncbi:sucrose transport protein SUC4 isoform X4 [Cucumis sativus]|uniref:sucrose transport protein SUC4 isoform X4 n=1 Tax=Cucumis sativus TaxID=3659 RepID=UPI0012F4BE9A|nr:sucrose transport protein SUC4 isoform X4 [Cucumis sativus]